MRRFPMGSRKECVKRKGRIALFRQGSSLRLDLARPWLPAAPKGLKMCDSTSSRSSSTRSCRSSPSPCSPPRTRARPSMQPIYGKFFKRDDLGTDFDRFFLAAVVTAAFPLRLGSLVQAYVVVPPHGGMIEVADIGDNIGQYLTMGATQINYYVVPPLDAPPIPAPPIPLRADHLPRHDGGRPPRDDDDDDDSLLDDDGDALSGLMVDEDGLPYGEQQPRRKQQRVAEPGDGGDGDSDGGGSEGWGVHSSSQSAGGAQTASPFQHGQWRRASPLRSHPIRRHVSVSLRFSSSCTVSSR